MEFRCKEKKVRIQHGNSMWKWKLNVGLEKMHHNDKEDNKRWKEERILKRREKLKHL